MICGRVSGCLFALAVLACSEDGAHPGAGGNRGASGGQSAAVGGTTSSAGTPNHANGGAGTTGAGTTNGDSGGTSGGVAGAQARADASNAGQSGSAGRAVDGGGNGGRAVASGNGGRAGSSAMSGAAGKQSTPTPVKDLPLIKEMPDPLTMNDGTKVTTPEQWQARRQELIALLEDYEYGHMPPPPGNVTATTTTATTRISASGLDADYRMLHLTFGPDAKLGFDLGIFTPASDTPQKFPILISLTSSASRTSLGSASAALARGYAVATVPYGQLGADATNWASTAFFPAYPDYDWRDFSAWAWGLSRAVDYLVTDAAVDADKIMITGVSRLGQAVLLAGAFDERIALSAPVAAGAAFRFSGKEMGGGLGQGITEVVDQNTYWFGPVFPQFKNQTPRLPSDQHWLPALTAPRLFIMCNSLQDQYGRAYAAVQTYEYAKPVYQLLLGSDQNMGVNFREGTHGMTAEDWSALLDFADQNLLKKPGTRTFDVLPPADELP